MNKKQMEDEILKIEMAVLCGKNNLIDIIAFNYLTSEKKLPFIIKTCSKVAVDRYKFVDSLKEQMLTSIIEDVEFENNTDLSDELDKDLDLIPVDFLVSHTKKENKRTILFNLCSIYPEVMEIILKQVEFEVNRLIVNCCFGVTSRLGFLYEKCTNKDK